MIFSCGESWAAKNARLSDWHPFFTLLPCKVAEVNGHDVCAWLCWIERRGTRYDGLTAFPPWWRWEYRA